MKPLNPSVWVLSIVFAFAAAVAVPSQTANRSESTSQHGVRFQPLNVKPGLWERTLTSKSAGQIPIPSGMLDRLTPEQRARVEERMKSSASARTRTHTEKECVTRQDLQKAPDFGQGKKCTYRLDTSTSTEAKGSYSCVDQDMNANGTVEIQAPDPEHTRGSAHGNLTGAGREMSFDTTFTSKWLGPNCGNVK
jgi:hypothetical protein